MKNLIVLGDSFCSNSMFWPSYLANALERNLICYTNGAGQSWWDARHWLEHLDENLLDDCDIMVFAHTNADRIPSTNRELGLINHSVPPTTEIEKSIHLYYKYIHNQNFLHWAQQQWFREISRTYGQKYLVHLHCFPWTLEYRHHLQGLNITTNLTALSLNEIGSKEFALYSDDRPNHLNEYNNEVLAIQLSDLIKKRIVGDHELDHQRFQQKTLDWFFKKQW